MISVKVINEISLWLSAIACVAGTVALALYNHPAPAVIYFAGTVSWTFLTVRARHALRIFEDNFAWLQKQNKHVLNESIIVNKQLIRAEQAKRELEWKLGIVRGSSQEDLDAVADHTHYDPKAPLFGEGREISPLTDPDYFTHDAILWARWVSRK